MQWLNEPASWSEEPGVLRVRPVGRVRTAPPPKEFEPQRHDIEAKPSGDRIHQALVFRVLELDDLTCLHVDQVIMRPILGGLIPRPATTEVPAFQDALFLEQPHGPVYRRD